MNDSLNNRSYIPFPFYQLVIADYNKVHIRYIHYPNDVNNFIEIFNNRLLSKMLVK